MDLKRNALFAKHLIVLAVMLVLAGCAGMPRNPDGMLPSYHLNEHISAPVTNLLEDQPAPDLSGFHLINQGIEALVARMVLIEQAQVSLDLQYYIWHADDTGLLLMDRLVKAADRGVRVRLLLDDRTAWGRDKGLARIHAHRNISVKLYNPLGGARSGSFLRTAAAVGNFRRINHRMHNKILVMDNAVALLGGRNIGDEYFGIASELNFRDLDVLTVGPVVEPLSGAFDRYWNSDWSITMDAIEPDLDSSISDAELRSGLASAESAVQSTPAVVQPMAARDGYLSDLKGALIWSSAEVLSDPPRKDLVDEGEVVRDRLSELTGQIQSELFFVSPYLVPTARMLNGVEGLRNRGVSVKILTNSLAATDVRMVHFGYASKRRRMLEMGVELFELRPDAADSGLHAWPETEHESILGLHAKAAVYDKKAVFIGSLNLDPRSISINTEVGLFIHSEILAKALLDSFAPDIAKRNSYHPELQAQGRNKKLIWTTEVDGQEVVLTKEAGGKFRDGLSKLLLALLPIRSQL